MAKYTVHHYQGTQSFLIKNETYHIICKISVLPSEGIIDRETIRNHPAFIRAEKICKILNDSGIDL